MFKVNKLQFRFLDFAIGLAVDLREKIREPQNKFCRSL